MGIGYEEENGKKAIQNSVSSPGQGENISPLYKDTVLLKEPGLYCFLLRCKKPKAEPFMKWVVETVFEPREVRKLASAVEEKDVTIVLMNDDLQDRDNQIQAIKYENVACRSKVMSIKLSYKDVRIPSPILKNVMFLMQEILVKITS